MQNQRSILLSMLALPRASEQMHADYSLIALYDSICAAESQYAGKIVALCKPKSRYGNGGTGCPVCPNRAGGSPILGKDSAAAAAGAFAVPTAEGKKGRHLRFLPSLNTHFPCNHSLGADGRLRKQEKGNGRGFLLPRGITPFRISAAVLLHPIWVCAGAAQGELPVGQERVPWGISVPRKPIASANRLQPQDVDNQHR